MLGRPCDYFRKRCVAVNEFTYEGALPLESACCEWQVRSLAVSRKNNVFSGSDGGAERAAILYSLLRTAAPAGVETYGYLIKLLERPTAAWSQDRIDELLHETATRRRSLNLKPVA